LSYPGTSLFPISALFCHIVSQDAAGKKAKSYFFVGEIAVIAEKKILVYNRKKNELTTWCDTDEIFDLVRSDRAGTQLRRPRR
jgi:hypothetical protein